MHPMQIESHDPSVMSAFTADNIEDLNAGNYNSFSADHIENLQAETFASFSEQGIGQLEAEAFRRPFYVGSHAVQHHLRI